MIILKHIIIFILMRVKKQGRAELGQPQIQSLWKGHQIVTAKPDGCCDQAMHWNPPPPPPQPPPTQTFNCQYLSHFSTN